MQLILARVKQRAAKEISAQALTEFLVVCEFSCLILQVHILQDTGSVKARPRCWNTRSPEENPRTSFLRVSQDLAFGCKEVLVRSLQLCFAQLPPLHGHMEARPHRAAASCCSPNKVCGHIKQNHAEPF